MDMPKRRNPTTTRSRTTPCAAVCLSAGEKHAKWECKLKWKRERPNVKDFWKMTNCRHHRRDLEEEAQAPPKVVAERYACMNMTCLCPYLGGTSSGPDHCEYGGGASSNKNWTNSL
uniref:Uncharacterized protein n=1 Tax=Globodera pallida TaxID=36090 RepID=A0A183BW74_GLOPA